VPNFLRAFRNVFAGSDAGAAGAENDALRAAEQLVAGAEQRRQAVAPVIRSYLDEFARIDERFLDEPIRFYCAERAKQIGKDTLNALETDSALALYDAICDAHPAADARAISRFCNAVESGIAEHEKIDAALSKADNFPDITFRMLRTVAEEVIGQQLAAAEFMPLGLQITDGQRRHFRLNALLTFMDEM
jgi:hypothetical protein